MKPTIINISNTINMDVYHEFQKAIQELCGIYRHLEILHESKLSFEGSFNYFLAIKEPITLEYEPDNQDEYYRVIEQFDNNLFALLSDAFKQELPKENHLILTFTNFETGSTNETLVINIDDCSYNFYFHSTDE